MLNDLGKSLFKPWFSVQNVALGIALVFIAVLLIRSFSLSNGDVASWVQAFGSIAAIVFAAYLPIWHGDVALKQRQKSLAEIMRVISDDAVESLSLLSITFNCPERERSQMAKYEVFHRGRDWIAIADQLAQIPVAELSPASAKALSYLKDAVGFGEVVASKVPEWIKNGGHSRPDVVRLLRQKRDLVAEIRSQLPIPNGVLSPYMMHSQAVARVNEMKRPQPEPVLIGDAEFYRRYVWPEESSGMPDYVYVHGIYPNLDDFGPLIIKPDGKFSDFYYFNEYVKEMCLKCHEQHVEIHAVNVESGISIKDGN